jgi:membrane protein
MQLPKPMRRYMSIQGPMIAAGLAYFAFMSLIPLVMIAIAAAAFIYGGGVEKERIVRALGQLLPSGVTTARDIVDVLVQNRGKIGIAAGPPRPSW